MTEGQANVRALKGQEEVAIDMNSKKTKRNKEESLLITYNSAEGGGAVGRSSESDDNVPPLDLPPTRLRRPRSRYYHLILFILTVRDIIKTSFTACCIVKHKSDQLILNARFLLRV